MLLPPQSRPRASAKKRFLALTTALITLLGLVSAPSAVASEPVPSAIEAASIESVRTVPAANLALFDAGNIISNAVFFNKGALTEAQIQTFLESKVPTCRATTGPTCLRTFRADLSAKSADKYCAAIPARTSATAAQIISAVATACGINPMVILVMLQKEQGLVTSTAPSDWSYRAAMGMACPDTAPCDAAAAGFVNQLYLGTRQLQVYTLNPTLFSYQAGKTNTIKWNPADSCGTSQVYIQNQATANLYIYTPYRPNAAALAAGYGLGDSCSSYGNRNFYNYFTDWFGTTQTTNLQLVKSGAEVSILSGTRRYGITAEAYPEYKRVFGSPTVVDAAYLSLFSNAGVATFYVRNTANGEVAMLQDGKTHPFTSCGLVGAWGGECGAGLVQLEPREYTAFVRGELMTAFARTEAGGKIHQIIGTTLQPYYDAVAAASANGEVTPYAAVLRASVTNTYTVAERQLFAPARFVLQTGDPTVWLPTRDGVLVGLPAWSLAAELGLPTSVGSRVNAADLTGYTKGPALSQYVVCGGSTYFGASGGFSKVLGGTPAGFEATVLDEPTCALLTLTRPAFATVPFVKTASNATVYRAENGTYRPIPSTAKMIQLNGGVRPTVATISAATLARYKVGSVYLLDGTLVKADGDPSVWFVDGDRLRGLPSWGMARAYGLPSPARAVGADSIAGLERAPSLTHFVTCDGTLYAAGGDSLSRVTSGDPAGNTVTALTSSACALLPRNGAAISGSVFVTDGSHTAVAVGGGFLRLPDLASILRANGGTMPSAKWVTAAYFSSLPTPIALPASGDLVRASNSASVTLVDGSRRLGIPNWGVAADLGVQPRYQIVTPSAVTMLPISQNVGVFVRCGTTDYIAAQGVLSSITTTGLAGARAVPLDTATCATLDLTGPPIAGRVFVQAAGSTQVLVTESGGLRPLRAGESATTLNGGTAPRILILDSRTVAGLPKT